MTAVDRIALIHATRLAIDPIVSEFEASWPDVEHVSLLDEALSIDRARDSELTDDLHRRIVSLARYAEEFGANGILYTCSAFGSAIEYAALGSNVPVLKPNEAMLEKALLLGENVAMIYTFQPAVAGMEQEFREESLRGRSSARIRSICAEGAREALEQGDSDTHNRLIAQTVEGVKDADVVLLAHFSMARAADAARSSTDLPVLSSPETAVEKLKATILA